MRKMLVGLAITALIAVEPVSTSAKELTSENINPNNYIESRTTSTVKNKAPARAFSTQASATVKTVTTTRKYKSLVNITVAKHIAATSFAYDGDRLYTTGRGMDNDWWTLPPNFKSGDNKKWDWYQAKEGGTGRSNMQVEYTWGVPTPWGPVGSNYSSRIKHYFTSSGSYKSID